jgi:hypothetical protein
MGCSGKFWRGGSWHWLYYKGWVFWFVCLLFFKARVEAGKEIRMPTWETLLAYTSHGTGEKQSFCTVVGGMWTRVNRGFLSSSFNLPKNFESKCFISCLWTRKLRPQVVRGITARLQNKIQVCICLDFETMFFLLYQKCNVSLPAVQCLQYIRSSSNYIFITTVFFSLTVKFLKNILKLVEITHSSYIL